MCKQYPMDEAIMPHKTYSTWERNQAQGILKSCSQCSKRKQRRCLGKSMDLGERSFSPMKKRRFVDNGALRPSPQVLKGQMINRRHGFKLEVKEDKVKIIPIIYGRTVDRYAKQIHS